MSNLSRFRNRIGKSGCELILKSTVIAELIAGALKKSDLKRVTVDTAVQEMAMTCPTDRRLLNRGSLASGETSSINWYETSPKLCSSGSELNMLMGITAHSS